MMIKKIFKYGKIAFISIRENPGRSFLTMLGVIIGVASVVVVTSLGKGAEKYILGSVAQFGPDLIYITSGSPSDGLSGSITAMDRLKYTDYLALQNADFLSDVTPFNAVEDVVVYENANYKTQIIGVNKNYPLAFNFHIDRGRFVDDADTLSAQKIVVLGRDLASILFGEQDPISKTVKIRGMGFRVVGIMEEQGGNITEDYDKMVFMPITTMRTYLFGVDYVMTIVARVKGDLDLGIEKTKDYIRALHRIDNPFDDPTKDDFQIISQVQALEVFGLVASVMTYFVSAIASISLMVGGVGIMNIMYMSVNQRIREIGLRKAVGATKLEILLQFVVEAALIAFLGGLLGIIFGILISFGLSLLLQNLVDDWSFLLNLEAMMLATLVSILIGVFFGYAPAKKASKADPIEALRYE